MRRFRPFVERGAVGGRRRIAGNNHGEAFALGPTFSYNPGAGILLNAHWVYEVFTYNRKKATRYGSGRRCVFKSARRLAWFPPVNRTRRRQCYAA